MERDPRVDPRPGDRLKKERRRGDPMFPLFRKVCASGIKRRRRRELRDGVVRFYETIWRPGSGLWTEAKGASLSDWRAWAKTATVIKRAEEPPLSPQDS
jgi:hypothetical protein